MTFYRYRREKEIHGDLDEILRFDILSSRYTLMEFLHRNSSKLDRVAFLLIQSLGMCQLMRPHISTWHRDFTLGKRETDLSDSDDDLPSAILMFDGRAALFRHEDRQQRDFEVS